ncbi:MAG: cytochrome c biogenesis CcdA family protein [Minisyncoccia bacterium]
MLALAPAAFLAGLLMFLAPCTLPVVPGYLAFISAVPSGGLAASRRKIFGNALAFVIGFSIMFILLGLFAGLVGSVLGEWRFALARLAGVILILFGLVMLGRAAVPALAQEYRVPLPRFLTLGRWESSLIIGLLFALGWSPCIGPILGSIFFLASSSATAPAGAVLLAIFSLGLAIPFMLCALLIDRASRGVSRLAALSGYLQTVGGIVLIALGVLMLFNMMALLVGWGYSIFGFAHYGMLMNYL